MCSRTSVERIVSLGQRGAVSRRGELRIPLDSATRSGAPGHPFRSTRPRSERSDGILDLAGPTSRSEGTLG